MPKYKLKWTWRDYGKYEKIPTEYDSLDKARASARRRVNYASGQYAIGIIEIKDGKQKFLGEVMFDWNYNYGGASGIFWIPKGKGEGYIASGVSANGKLNSQKYRLT